MSTEKTLKRLAYYAKGIFRDLIPSPIYAARLSSFRSWIENQPIDQNIIARVNYYNKLSASKTYNIKVGKSPSPFNGSRYYYDLAEILNYFDDRLKVAFIFLDLRAIPEQPSIVKSRPIEGENENSVLFKYIKLRNYVFYDDKYTWEEKLPKAVWRGGLNNKKWRKDLVLCHHANARCDIGHTKGNLEGIPPKPFMAPSDQLRYRYQISVEGNDVGTNLKWISASNSLCLMPRPRYETWFMEGNLQAGIHYVELRPDYEDLDDKMDYYDRHPDEAKAIIANANAHARQFLDLKQERTISLLVLQKYFERTGQADAWGISDRLFS